MYRNSLGQSRSTGAAQQHRHNSTYHPQPLPSCAWISGIPVLILIGMKHKSERRSWVS
ncbi:hypothetical protein SESBI_05399 [Sesbania bispinosa]|nr:hypothetical protein SESBI_05399 [Sesbania bispinosa]